MFVCGADHSQRCSISGCGQGTGITVMDEPGILRDKFQPIEADLDIGLHILIKDSYRFGNYRLPGYLLPSGQLIRPGLQPRPG